MSIGGRHANRRSQHVNAPALNRFVEIGRETRVPIMQEEVVVLIAGKRFSELVQSPLSCGMFGDVEVYETSGSDLERHKYMEDAEARRDRYEEVASYDPVGVISQEC